VALVTAPKRPGRGGRRAGAGRPPSVGDGAGTAGQFSLRLGPELLRAVRAYAKRRGLTVAEAARELLRAGLGLS